MNRAILFVNEAFMPCKAIAATGESVEQLPASAVPQDEKADPALIASENGDATKIASRFIKAIAQHRNWDREEKAKIPA